MNIREFLRFHLLKALLALVAIQVIIVAVVQNYNHRPIAQPDQVTIVEGRTLSIAPLTNDSDKDEEDELSLQSFSIPLHGLAEQRGNLIYYSPDEGFSGADSLTYTVSDGHKKSKSGIILITVNKNLEPIAMGDLIDLYCGLITKIDVLRNDNDREGDSIYIKNFSQPVFGKLSLKENSFIYLANSSINQVDSFYYVISDGKNLDSATVRINVLSKNNPCFPWISSDIGDAAIPGSFSCVNKTYVIEASGSDIWNSYDGCHFAYQYIEGDCEMYTKVESLEGSNEWAKAGIMVRESLEGGSKMAMVFLSTKNGATYHQREYANNPMEGGDQNVKAVAPYWIKLVRKGNSFSYYDSPDGKKWNNLATAEVNLNKAVYIGFAVTSHNNSEIGKGVFSNYHLKAKNVKL